MSSEIALPLSADDSGKGRPGARGPATVLPALPRQEKLSYGAGEIASNLSWNMVTGFLLLYYTDVALLPIAALGTLMLSTRVLDAVFDPLVGILVDRTKSRFGKARPYLLWGSIPFGLLTIATFSVPDWSPGAKLAYAYVTFILLGLLYSILYVPYSSMLPMMTRDRREKAQLGGYRAMGTSIASILAYGSVLPLVAMLGSGDRKFGFTATAAILGLVSSLLFLLVFRNCHERLSRPLLAGRTPVRESLRQMVANPIWRIVFAAAILIFVKIGVMVASFAFLAKDVLGAPGAVSVALPLMSVAILVGGYISRPYLTLMGKRRGNILALALSLVLALLLPFVESNLTLFVAIFAISNLVGGIQAATMFILSADAVELQEARHADRSEGLLASTVSFGTKVGMALGVAITAYALGWAGYNPAHATPDAAAALRWVFYGGQALLTIVLMIVMSFYTFDERPIATASAAPGELKI